MSTAEAAAVSDSSFVQRNFDFTAQTNYDAYKDLIHTRNAQFQVNPKSPPYDIWKRRPPDFRFQAYASEPPKRNSKLAMRPEQYSSASDARFARWRQDRRETVPLPPKGAVTVPGSDGALSLPEMPQFRTRFRLMRPFSAKVHFVREGQNVVGRYSVPRPHDFRQYPPVASLGLSEFTTHKEPDPYNIRFLLANRGIIKGALHEVSNIRDVSGTMAGPVKQPEKWEQRLHLPNNKWPHRPTEYTFREFLNKGPGRYRIPWRDPDEAFMDRVEEKLEERWALEKLTGPVM